jgi:hypothetical protein
VRVFDNWLVVFGDKQEYLWCWKLNVVDLLLN